MSAPSSLKNVPPAIDLDGGGGGTGFAATYLENAAPIQVVDNAITIDDPNDPNLAAATVVLANAQAGDVMTVGDLTGLGITSSIDTSVAGQITVTLTGPSLDTNFETALKRVFFGNASENPATTQRVLNITVSDGTLTSPNATTTIDIVSQNDAPVNSVPATQTSRPTRPRRSPAWRSPTWMPARASLTTTLSVAARHPDVASAGGAAVGGSGTATVTLTGTLAQINATLAAANNVVYSRPHDFFGTDTLTMLDR